MEAVVDRIMIPQMQQSPPLPRPGPAPRSCNVGRGTLQV